MAKADTEQRGVADVSGAKRKQSGQYRQTGCVGLDLCVALFEGTGRRRSIGRFATFCNIPFSIADFDGGEWSDIDGHDTGLASSILGG